MRCALFGSWICCPGVRKRGHCGATLILWSMSGNMSMTVHTVSERLSETERPVCCYCELFERETRSDAHSDEAIVTQKSRSHSHSGRDSHGAAARYGLRPGSDRADVCPTRSSSSEPTVDPSSLSPAHPNIHHQSIHPPQIRRRNKPTNNPYQTAESPRSACLQLDL